MKVRTCHLCPYSPEDLGQHYSQRAEELCCLACPVLRVAATAGFLRQHRESDVREGDERALNFSLRHKRRFREVLVSDQAKCSTAVDAMVAVRLDGR